MDVVEAKHQLEAWKKAAEFRMKCEVKIDDGLTEEYPWGWVFHFVPVRPEECPLEYKHSRFAVARVTGDSQPVGTKGVKGALVYLKTGDPEEWQK